MNVFLNIKTLDQKHFLYFTNHKKNQGQHLKKFSLEFFWAHNVLRLNIISWPNIFLDPTLFGPKTFVEIHLCIWYIFWTSNFFGPKLFFSFDSKTFYPNFLGLLCVWLQYFLGPKIFRIRNCFWTQHSFNIVQKILTQNLSNIEFLLYHF